MGNFAGQKKRALEILGKVNNKMPIMNVERAANKQIHKDEMRRWVKLTVSFKLQYVKK